MIKPYETISSEIAFDSKYLKVLKDEFISSNGNKGEFFYITNFHCISALGMDNDNNFIMVKEYRYPIKQVSINAVGGRIDEGENPEETAQRELMEEVGYKGNEIINLGKTAYAGGRCDGWLHMFLIKDCIKVNESKHQEDTEVTEEYKLAIDNAWDFVKNNTSPLAHTNLLITRALLYLNIAPKW